MTEAVNFSKQPKNWNIMTCQSGGGGGGENGTVNIPNSVRRVPKANRPGQHFLHPKSGLPLKNKLMKRNITYTVREVAAF